MDRFEYLDKDKYFSVIYLTNHDMFMLKFTLKYLFLLQIFGIEPF